jgi:DNA mismatch repair protein MutS
MLERYAELKAQLPPGTILFYQVGTFFETFEEDAKKISQALSIRLTSREAAGYAGGRVPLAGVPNHALQEHLATLLRKGHSVAVAEQRQHPSSSRARSRRYSRPARSSRTTSSRRGRRTTWPPSWSGTGGPVWPS